MTEKQGTSTETKHGGGQALNGLKHGAFSYLGRTENGSPIPRELALVESQVIAEVNTDGPRERVRKQAIRFATASEALWGHMLSGEEAFRRGLKNWGWIAGAEIRAWRDYYAISEPDDDDAARVLEAVSRE